MCGQYRKQLGKDMKLDPLVALACMAVELAKAQQAGGAKTLLIKAIN
jgi:hypothetical protein